MIASTVSLASSQATSAPPSRVVSIDIFRGLTMAVMIFVNAVAEVRGLPWWTAHAHAWEDRMTYVDMVFPFFLFAAGMSMPLAVTQRLKRNPSTFALCLHIVLRVLGLLRVLRLLGVLRLLLGVLRLLRCARRPRLRHRHRSPQRLRHRQAQLP